MRFLLFLIPPAVVVIFLMSTTDTALNFKDRWVKWKRRRYLRSRKKELIKKGGKRDGRSQTK